MAEGADGLEILHHLGINREMLAGDVRLSFRPLLELDVDAFGFVGRGVPPQSNRGGQSGQHDERNNDYSMTRKRLRP